MKISESELAARRSRIIHEAFQLFCQEGIDKVTIKEISLKAKVGEKSVYRYFNTKTELIISTVDVLWKEIISELIASIGPDYEQKTGLEQVDCLLHCFRNLFENYSNYVLFSYDYKLFLVRHNALLKEHTYIDEIRPIHDMYIKALNKGMKDGSIGVHTDTEDLYNAMWGLIRGYIVKIVIYDRMYEGRNMWLERFDLACSLVIKGIKYNT